MRQHVVGDRIPYRFHGPVQERYAPSTYRLERYAPSSSLMNCCICSAVNLAESNDPRLFWPKWMLTIRSFVIPITYVLGVAGAVRRCGRLVILEDLPSSGLTLLSKTPGSESTSSMLTVPPSSDEDDSTGASAAFLGMRLAFERSCFNTSTCPWRA